MTSSEGYLARLDTAVDGLKREAGSAPSIGVVLGSGLSAKESWPIDASIPYMSIAGFPESSVPGHPGELWSVAVGHTRLAVLAGRHHFYEGYPLSEVVFPVRALAAWGVRNFILTNAAGAINPRLQPGDLMLIRDHINLMGESPLRGPYLARLGERFVDLGLAYDPSLRALAHRVSQEQGLDLQEGVYIAVPGPHFETPAEIRVFAAWGADAVGMSTVPEVIALAQMRCRVAAISVISNRAAGPASGPLSHAEVLRIGAEAGRRLVPLILRISRLL